MQGAGTKAIEEFQRILAHRGTDPFSPVHPLALVGLARAFAMAGDISNSVKAYERFFSSWSSADSDVPLLRAARDEYERLKRDGRMARHNGTSPS